MRFPPDLKAGLARQTSASSTEVKTKVDRVKRTRIVSAVPQLVGRLAGASACDLWA